MDEAIVAGNLTKEYRTGVKALAGVTFHIKRGEIFGYLGRNGSGKTTTVRILTGLTRPTAGKAQVDGYNLPSEADYVRTRIGVTLQEAALDDMLTGAEHLAFIGGLWGLGNKAKTRADELLEQFGLTASADRRVGQYSGGMRRRLDIATALIMQPKILFLDEPTTGLDPRARSELWSVLDHLVDRGTTLLLTTQYLDEAERLADDIIVIDHGRIIARGDARKLKREVGGDQIQVVVVEPGHLAEATRIIESITGVAPKVDAGARSITAPTSLGVETLVLAAKEFTEAQIAVDDMSLRQPTLDEVFLTLTGSPADDTAEEAS